MRPEGGGCGPRYSADDLPVLQNNMFETAGEARRCRLGDIRLVQNPATRLVHNEAFDASRVVYDAGYQNEQAHSAVFEAHLQSVARIIGSSMGTEPVVEVGCGKGHFLRILRSRGIPATGLDPAFEGDEAGVVRGMLTADTRLQAGGIVLRHVLEHIEDPQGFLRTIAVANAVFVKVFETRGSWSGC